MKFHSEPFGKAEWFQMVPSGLKWIANGLKWIANGLNGNHESEWSYRMECKWNANGLYSLEWFRDPHTDSEWFRQISFQSSDHSIFPFRKFTVGSIILFEFCDFFF